MPGSAGADDAYVCEGGRIAYVNQGDLERVGRQDPCIAAYIARRSGAAPASPAIEAARAALQLDGQAPPVPTRRPSGSVAAAIASMLPPVPTASPVAKVVAAAFAPAAPSPSSQAQDEGTTTVDFRHVRILNAQPGEPTVFYHAR